MLKVLQLEKQKNLDANLLVENGRDYLPCNTTNWHNRNGKIKKAHAAKMQPSVALIFSVLCFSHLELFKALTDLISARIISIH